MDWVTTMPSFDPRNSETFTAPTNIAVIKYWGKKDVKLNTPLNSSASITLDQVYSRSNRVDTKYFEQISVRIGTYLCQCVLNSTDFLEYINF